MNQTTQNQAATPPSTSSSKPQTKGGESSSKGFYAKKIEALTLTNGKLEQELERLRAQLGDQQALRAQVAAKDQALNTKLGVERGDLGPLPPNAWLLLWQEYDRRTNGSQFRFQGTQGRKSIQCGLGYTWTITPLPNLNGLSDEHANIFIDMAERFGYDPYSPPNKDFILLHCFPNKAAYDMAVYNLEKAQEDYRKSNRLLQEALNAAEKARSRGRLDLTEKALTEADVLRESVTIASRQFHECREVMDNAIQQYFLISMESFEKMEAYGVPMNAHTVTVVPQKRHQDLPNIPEALAVA